MEEGYRRVVDMAEQEVVDGPVPVASVLIEGYGVPPRAIEASVGKPCDLCEYIE